MLRSGAVELTIELASGALSAAELMAATYDRIEALNPKVNALVSLIDREDAMGLAQAADGARRKGLATGPLHGLPIAVKDLSFTRGLRTTFGSPIFADFVPGHDALFVERLRAAGAIILGKTNTPEFGAGSHTFNPVFGVTRNPYDLGFSAGGSSGGAAAALASGMLALADGSDLGGSLRNPAAWCNVVGLRPSLGRIAEDAATAWFSRIGVPGPMARTARDAALLLSVMAGPDARDPAARAEPGAMFNVDLARDFKGCRIAWTPDLGHIPVEAQIIKATAQVLPVLETIGCIVEEAHPDRMRDMMTGAFAAFKVLRAAMFAELTRPFYDRGRAKMKPAVIWNIEAGRALKGMDITHAEAIRTQVYHRLRKFLETHDFLVLPVTQAPPFPVEQEYPTRVAGVAMENYIDWMEICCVISLTGLPAASVPVAFTGTGLPVGLQIVGRPGDDLGVLQLAHAIQAATPNLAQMPLDAALL